jgi:primosomal replication protein N
MNLVELSATVIERSALRYTPAGIPALDLRLSHESEVAEAGMPRKVSLEIAAVALGVWAEELVRQAVGTRLDFGGFLGKQRNGRGVVLHITRWQAPAPTESI